MKSSSARTGLALVAMLGISCSTTAQTMYRCGTSYQDQPCSSAQPSGKAIGNAGHAASNGAASNTTTSDATCHQRGLDAEKIRWAKEGGRTLQEAEEPDAGSAPFLQDVYARRGTAAEVRVAVEADCNDQLQRALEAARLNAAAAAILKGDPGAKTSVSSGAPSAGSAAHP